MASLKPEDQHMFMQIKTITEWKNESSSDKILGWQRNSVSWIQCLQLFSCTFWLYSQEVTNCLAV